MTAAHTSAQMQPALSPALLEVRDLSVSFGHGRVRALRGINMSIARGEIVALVGESGSGKSVAAKVIMGLVTYAGGHIEAGQAMLFDTEGQSQDLCALPEHRLETLRGDRITMIFQEPMTSLNPVLTIGFQLCESIVRHRRVRPADARQRALNLLEQVRISEPQARMRQYPHELSGGMRQRVMIAMALACKPDLLIADEPTTALDVTVQAEILELIRTLQRESGMAVLFITHDMGVVAEIADRVAVMFKGEIVEEGLASDIFSRPVHAYTRKLIDAAPRLGTATAPGAVISATATLPALSVRELCVRFPIRSRVLRRLTGHLHAVENVSFDLAKGETLAIVGESGSGKSTLARAILRLIEPTSGSIRLAGQEIVSLPPAKLKQLRSGLQIIFQDPFTSLNPRMRVSEILAEPFEIAGRHTRDQIRHEVATLLREVGLEPSMVDRHPHQFSGGQRQRICIARAIAMRPAVIVADEPVSALDVSTQDQILRLLRDLRDRFDMSLLCISHDMAVVEQISDRVAVMYLGEIVEIGPRASVFSSPSHPYTRKLIAAVPVPHPDLRRSRAVEASEARSAARKLGAPSVPTIMREIGPGHFVLEPLS